MLVTSRSFDEYRAFFALTQEDLAGRILDCGGGGAGFAAQSGAAVTVADPAFADTAGLAATIERGLRDGDAIIDRHDDHFVWDWYGTPDRRRAMRSDAARAFLADVVATPDRYVAASLPDLPFADGRFDLALSSHLLFTWADVFDLDWHEAALHELARVASEVRVFPLVVQGDGAPVPLLPELLERLRREGLEAQVVRVPYRFQVHGDEMLTLRRTSR